mmetsp:Transcript_27437/g.55339  ORF Transcript_27437/g.55339 Transcript_27437/m.55339 type:complete len:109 (+) Transcript_27437:781-1107(+)
MEYFRSSSLAKKGLAELAMAERLDMTAASFIQIGNVSMLELIVVRWIDCLKRIYGFFVDWYLVWRKIIWLVSSNVNAFMFCPRQDVHRCSQWDWERGGGQRKGNANPR